MKTELVVSFEYEGTHFWPNPPEKFEEFGQEHRHIFKFIVFFSTIHRHDPTRRDYELFEARRFCLDKVDQMFNHQFGGMSCEGIADAVINLTRASKVFVGEDYWLGAWVSQA